MRWAAAAVLIAACVPAEGPAMDPGENCQGCHGSGNQPLYQGEERRHATDWTIAGTVFDVGDAGVEGAEVQITDSAGFSFSLRSNLAGNFYSKETVAFPLQACIARDGRTVCQESPVASGSCNACHNAASAQLPQAELIAP
ncbi:MAG TPA: carboxypeptidase-like regulatory domain-containing protein [Myxococcales bacterium]|jgi:hypothetical protein